MALGLESSSAPASDTVGAAIPPDMTADRIGGMDPARFQTTADIALKLRVITAPADPAKSYTNAFVTAP